MHPHRTGAACCCAATRGRQPWPVEGEQGFDRCREARVVGVGAPLSVLIRPSADEIALLRDQVQAALADHDREPPPAGTPAADWWADERAVFTAMLAQLDEQAAPRIELTWPTAYAHNVLLGALREAVARLEPPSTPVDARRLREALATACNCFATWQAFIAIDHGELEDEAQ